jgi:hypothetical protein
MHGCRIANLFPTREDVSRPENIIPDVHKKFEKCTVLQKIMPSVSETTALVAAWSCTDVSDAPFQRRAILPTAVDAGPPR